MTDRLDTIDQAVRDLVTCRHADVETLWHDDVAFERCRQCGAVRIANGRRGAWSDPSYVNTLRAAFCLPSSKSFALVPALAKYPELASALFQGHRLYGACVVNQLQALLAHARGEVFPPAAPASPATPTAKIERDT